MTGFVRGLVVLQIAVCMAHGRVAIEFGAYGLPETYVVGADGTIAYRVVGPLTRAALGQTLLPLISGLRHHAGKATE